MDGSISETQLAKHLKVNRPSLKAGIELAVKEGFVRADDLGGNKGNRLTPLAHRSDPSTPEDDGQEDA